MDVWWVMRLTMNCLISTTNKKRTWGGHKTHMSMCDNKFLAREQQICAWERYEGFSHLRCLYLTTFRTMLSCSSSLLVIRGPFQHELD